MKWIELIKYPKALPYADERAVELMDIMEELVPIVWYMDRLGTFLKWREACEKAGLIDSNDKAILAREMIHGCGGL